MYMMAGSRLIVFSMRMFSQGLQVLLEEYVLKISNWMGLTASINFVSGILLSFGIQKQFINLHHGYELYRVRFVKFTTALYYFSLNWDCIDGIYIL